MITLLGLIGLKNIFTYATVEPVDVTFKLNFRFLQVYFWYLQVTFAKISRKVLKNGTLASGNTFEIVQ